MGSALGKRQRVQPDPVFPGLTYQDLKEMVTQYLDAHQHACHACRWIPNLVSQADVTVLNETAMSMGENPAAEHINVTQRALSMQDVLGNCRAGCSRHRGYQAYTDDCHASISMSWTGKN